MKILLVEDDMEISAMLKSFLMTENYEVIAVSDGESACEKFFSDDMMAVWSFNFAALVLSKLVIYLCIFMGSKYMRSSFAIDFDMGSLTFVGMAAKSSKAVIITSFLLIFLTQANVGDFTMADNAVFPLVLTAVSFGFAVLSICNVENKDVL